MTPDNTTTETSKEIQITGLELLDQSSDDQSVESYSNDSMFKNKQRMSVNSASLMGLNKSRTSLQHRQHKRHSRNPYFNNQDNDDDTDNCDSDQDNLNTGYIVKVLGRTRISAAPPSDDGDSVSCCSSYANDSVEVRRISYSSRARSTSNDSDSDSNGSADSDEVSDMDYANDSVMLGQQSFRRSQRQEEDDFLLGLEDSDDDGSLGYRGPDDLGYTNPEDPSSDGNSDLHDSVDFQKFAGISRRQSAEFLNAKRRYSNAAQQPIESSSYHVAYNRAA